MNKVDSKPLVRRYHQASWDEPVIFELDREGQIGVEMPAPDPALPAYDAPECLRRKAPPALPRVSQPRVLRHFLRLSQENLGADLNPEIGQGTCTMKYSPVVHERAARDARLTELHPLQQDADAQGILAIQYRLQRMLCEISGLDACTLQPQSGSQALMTMLSIVRAYHESRGDAARDEVIVTTFSHPSAAAAAIVKGYAVKTVRPRADGYPDFVHFQELVSARTAAFLCANPEDTGLYNGDIARFTALAKAQGALCAYDQANANGLFGVTRAGDAGFDLCFFNLHKSFSAPHGCGGPGTGAVCVSGALEDFLPSPRIVCENGAYMRREQGGASARKVRMFQGAAQAAFKAYLWLMSLGAEGLRDVADTAVLNNRYLYQKVLTIDGVDAPFDPAAPRVEQARYSLEKVCRETGVTAEQIGLRMADYGLHFWTSHHPFIVPQPMTLEPTESPSRDDLDEYAATLAHVVSEARTDPELVRTAPHRCAVHKNDESSLDDPAQWAVTWRAYLRKFQ